MNAMMLTWMIVLVLLAALAVVLLAVDFWRRWIEKKDEDKQTAAAEKMPQKRKFRSPEADAGKSRGQLAEPPKVEFRKSHASATGYLDLMGSPRPLYTVVLPPDGAKLSIPMPTKALADRFGQIGKTIQALQAGKGGLEEVEDLFMLTALVLANNREGVVVTTAYVAERLSSDETVQLLTDYMRWIREQLNEKN